MWVKEAVSSCFSPLRVKTGETLSDGLRNVFKMYDDTIDVVPLLVKNKDFSLQLLYWMVDMEATDGVVANKFIKAQDMQINKVSVVDKPIHKVHYEKQTFILVNHYMAESVLRRLPVGVYFQEVKAV